MDIKHNEAARTRQDAHRFTPRFSLGEEARKQHDARADRSGTCSRNQAGGPFAGRLASPKNPVKSGGVRGAFDAPPGD